MATSAVAIFVILIIVIIVIIALVLASQRGYLGKTAQTHAAKIKLLGKQKKSKIRGSAVEPCALTSIRIPVTAQNRLMRLYGDDAYLNHFYMSTIMSRGEDDEAISLRGRISVTCDSIINLLSERTDGNGNVDQEESVVTSEMTLIFNRRNRLLRKYYLASYNISCPGGNCTTIHIPIAPPKLTYQNAKAMDISTRYRNKLQVVNRRLVDVLYKGRAGLESRKSNILLEQLNAYTDTIIATTTHYMERDYEAGVLQLTVSRARAIEVARALVM